MSDWGSPEVSGTSAAPVRVKICGLTRVADALACARAGADWVGLNFHPPSPRSIDPVTAAAIVAALPPECEPVGVFVDRPPAEVAELARRLGIRHVQLHGAEPPEDLEHLGHLRVIRAFRLADQRGVASLRAYLDRAEALGHAPYAVLVDAYVAGQEGGTGRTVAAELLAHLPAHPRLILAGGLTPENIAQHVTTHRPWMVDVASGVESAPGRKDTQRIAAFIEHARAATRGG